MGEVADAVSHAKMAQALDPLTATTNQTLSRTLLDARKYDEAAAAATKGLAIDSTFSGLYVSLMEAEMLSGHADSAARVADRALRIARRGLGVRSAAIWAYTRAGRKRDADALLAELRRDQSAGKRLGARHGARAARVRADRFGARVDRQKPHASRCGARLERARVRSDVRCAPEGCALRGVDGADGNAVVRGRAGATRQARSQFRDFRRIPNVRPSHRAQPLRQIPRRRSPARRAGDDGDHDRPSHSQQRRGATHARTGAGEVEHPRHPLPSRRLRDHLRLSAPADHGRSHIT